jgi:hypothetical protein
MDQPKQNVLGPDVVVVEHSRLFLGKNDYTSGTVGKALKHFKEPLFLTFDKRNARRLVRLPAQMRQSAARRETRLEVADHPGIAQGVGLDALQIEEFGDALII